MRPNEIKSHLKAKSTLLVYFTDSEQPATILDVAGKSVYVKHGPRKFWIRTNNKMIERIVVK